MTDEEGTGRAPSAAPPESLEALTEEIGHARKELGETVEALVAKADVPVRAREKAAELAGLVSSKASQVKETASQVKVQAAARMGSAGAAAPGRVRRAAKQAASRARQRPAQLAAAAGGALLAGWLIVRRRR